MRLGLSWGAQAPHQVTVAGVRYEVRSTRIDGVWTAYGTVNGVCVEATGENEREARQKWQATVETATPILAVERRVESALDEAAAALDEAAQAVAAVDSLVTSTDSLASASAATADPFANASPHADLSSANLSSANLSSANLSSANLSSADQSSADPASGGAPLADAAPSFPLETCESRRSADRRLTDRRSRER